MRDVTSPTYMEDRIADQEEEITRLRRERAQLREALERLWAFREIGPSEWAWNEARRILDATTPEEEG